MTKEELLNLKINSSDEIEKLYSSFRDIMVYDEELCKVYDKEAIDTYLTSQSLIEHGYIHISTIYDIAGKIFRYFDKKAEDEKAECCELTIGDIAETFYNVLTDYYKKEETK